jgi:serine kinase of HPr protein (carbohydrate metabolism regulator)
VNVRAGNIHATAVALETSGVLIEGPSGSGKTSLALAAIRDAQNQNKFARLIADDQCLIMAANHRLIASCPPALTGMAEMRGLGVIQFQTERHSLSSIVIDLIIGLIDPSQMERIPQARTKVIAGVELPVFELPARQIAVALPLLCQIVENRRR